VPAPPPPEQSFLGGSAHGFRVEAVGIAPNLFEAVGVSALPQESCRLVLCPLAIRRQQRRKRGRSRAQFLSSLLQLCEVLLAVLEL
jgi:hypothetical protein